MSAKREDSLLGLGYTTIGTDKPTKARLKAVARAKGLTLSEYIRWMAIEVSKDKQGVLPSPSADVSLPGIANMLKSVMAKIDAWENPPSKRSLLADLNTLDSTFWHALGLNSTADDIALVRQALREYKERHGQLKLELSDV